MNLRALTRSDCPIHGESSLFSYGVCYHCSQNSRPAYVTEDMQPWLVRKRRQRDRDRMRAKRTAAQERAEREARGIIGGVP